MESLFGVYEKQFGNLTSEITVNLGKVTKLSQNERRQLMYDTSVLFGETNDLLEQMSLECQEMPSEMKEKYTSRVQWYRKEMGRLNTEFQNPRFNTSSAPSTNPSTTGYHGDDDDDVLYDSDMRARLLDNTDRVGRSTNLLEDGLRQSLYTQELGGHILSDLGEQREKLQRGRDRLHQVNGELQRSSRILTNMTRRVLKNRILLAIIIFFVIIVFIFAIYLSSRKSTHPTTPVEQPTPVAIPGASSSNIANKPNST